MNNDIGQTMVNTRLKVENRETVLVVDDDMTVRLLTSSILSDAGFIVLEASDGAKAIELVAGKKLTAWSLT